MSIRRQREDEEEVRERAERSRLRERMEELRTIRESQRAPVTEERLQTRLQEGFTGTTISGVDITEEPTVSARTRRLRERRKQQELRDIREAQRAPITEERLEKRLEEGFKGTTISGVDIRDEFGVPPEGFRTREEELAIIEEFKRKDEAVQLEKTSLAVKPAGFTLSPALLQLAGVIVLGGVISLAFDVGRGKGLGR